MVGHITYLSETSMHNKFGRRLQAREHFGYDFETDFAIEGYLRYKGSHFTERFDANSYLYITKAMDYFDLCNSHKSLAAAFANSAAVTYLVVSFTSDWLFPSRQSKDIVKALMNNDKDVSYAEIKSSYGHDAFLLETEQISTIISSFLLNV